MPQNTIRAQSIALQLKAGVAANTGTQVTPSVDAGYVGLYVVTVNFGQTTITAENISQYSNAPFSGGPFAPVAGNDAQPFAVGNAAQPNQAVALGQFTNLVPQMMTVVSGQIASGSTAEINLTVNTPGLLFAIGNINIAGSSLALQASYSNQVGLFLDGVPISGDRTQNVMTNASTRPITAGSHTVQYTVVPETNGNVGSGYSLWLSIIFIPFLPGYGG